MKILNVEHHQLSTADDIYFKSLNVVGNNLYYIIMMFYKGSPGF